MPHPDMKWMMGDEWFTHFPECYSCKGFLYG
jgi:hypothetical protein